MFSTHDTTKERLTARQREALERRNRMTQRRQELTSRIRKQKKSKYLQKKRSLPVTGTDPSVANANPAATTAEFKALLDSYCQNSVSLEQLLSALQHVVASTKTNAFSAYGTQQSDNPLVILEQNDEDLAVKFLDCLRRQTVEAISKQETMLFQTALRILVHLTSMTSSDGIGSSASDYYGRRPSTWSELVASPTQPSAVSIPSWMEILAQALSSSNEVELTSLVLGNLVGDDIAAGTIFHNASNDFKASLVTGLMRSVSPATPTAAWTLTNMIRNDPVSFGSSYCSESLLSSKILMAWLKEPSLATQTAWMIASLTAREEETVNYLCGKQHAASQEQEFPFLVAILQSIQNPLQPDQTVPLVQALGNLACHPSLVAPLLTKTTLVPLLQNILSTTPSRNPVLMQAAWLAGCVLVDVGVEHHPSTTVAAPALIPLLIERLGKGSERGDMGSQSMTCMTLEEEREFASALWNALDKPPGADDHEQQGLQPNQFLRPPSFELPFQLHVPSATIRSLVRLINSNDTDAVFAAINLVDLLLRRFDEHQNFQAAMQEEGMPDALDRICDSPMHHAADIAAEILDDYFYNDNNNESMEASENIWTNGLPDSAAPAFGVNSDNRAPSGLGRGRGRGATMPAWMTK